MFFFFLPLSLISSFGPDGFSLGFVIFLIISVGISETGRSDFVGDGVTSKKWKIMIEKLVRPTVYERFGTLKKFMKEKF